MARSLWSGSITFGLVNVPVKLVSAVSPKEVHFHQLHDKDGSRIKQKRFCTLEDKEVAYEHIVKGYEVGKGNYVMVTREELEALDPKATRSIDIEDFVLLDEIDPIFYVNTYFLLPDRGANKPYALLYEAMKKTGKVGIARMVMRTKQYLCAVRPMGEGLALSTMLYADEVVNAEDVEGLGKHGTAGARELAMAEQLIGALTTKFKPDKYQDDYREKVLDLIRAKSEGEEIVAPPAEEHAPKVVSLMDALKKSLAAKESGGKEETPAAEERGERRHAAKAARTARGPHRATRASGAKHARRSTAAKSRTQKKTHRRAKKR